VNHIDKGLTVTIAEATELMRNAVGSPDECRMMAVLADVWDESEGMLACGECDGDGVYFDTFPRQVDCEKCAGTGWVSNGNSLRAESLRLLAECGKVGAPRREVSPVHWLGGYWHDCAEDVSELGTVSTGWVKSVDEFGRQYDSADYYDPITNRLTLLDAYAAADQPTRERWARETRALVPTDRGCESCRGTGLTYVYMGHGDHVQQNCWPCHGTGRVSVTQEDAA
jgi:hypothetical protein